MCVLNDIEESEIFKECLICSRDIHPMHKDENYGWFTRTRIIMEIDIPGTIKVTENTTCTSKSTHTKIKTHSLQSSF